MKPRSGVARRIADWLHAPLGKPIAGWIPITQDIRLAAAKGR
jgi:hypothetical protein